MISQGQVVYLHSQEMGADRENPLQKLIRNTDSYNARLLQEEFQGRVLWFDDDKEWGYWDEKRGWVLGVQNVDRYVDKLVNQILPQIALKTGDKDDLRWARQSANNMRIRAAIDRVKSLVTQYKTDFDTDPFLLKVQNGVIDLRNGQFREHQITDKVLKTAAVTYNPEAKCPVYDQFINQITQGDQELITYIDKIFGHTLTGDCSEEVFFILYGKGQNGKSKLIEVISALLGDYGHKAESKTILKNQSEKISEGIASMEGKRLVYVSEIDDGQEINEGRIKELTGDEFIRSRNLYQKSKAFRITQKIYLLTNKKPVIRGADNGIWRRVRLIPFDYTVPEKLRDNRLSQKLKDELPGILNRLIAGCLLWQKEGLGIPIKVQQAIDTYREEMDFVGDFLNEHCEISGDPKVRVNIPPLYTKYREVAKEAGEEVLSPVQFSRKLKERNISQGKSGSQRFWIGIKLKE